MALPLFFNAAKASYDIEIVADSNKRKPEKKFVRQTKQLFSRLAAVMVGLCLLLTTGLLAAPAAMADSNIAADASKNLFCSVGAVNMHQKNLPSQGFGPNMDGLDPAKHKLTAYEKYGGLVSDYIMWIGPEKASNLKKGAYGAGQLRQLGGGEGSPVEDWGKNDPAKGDFATVKPGWYNTKGICINDAAAWVIGLANWSFSANANVVNAANLFLSYAFEGGSSTFNFLDEIVGSVFDAMVKSIYADLFKVIVMLSALTLAYLGWVKKAITNFVSAFFWLLGVAALSTAIFANPNFIPSVGTKFVGETSTASVRMVSSVMLTDPNVGNMCDADPVDIPGYDTARHEAFREMKCLSWYYIMYSPWVNGQFGQTPTLEDTRELGSASFKGGVQGIGEPLTDLDKPIYLGNTPATNKSWALYQMDNSIAWDGAPAETETNKALMNLAANQRYKDKPNMYWGSTDVVNFLSAGSVSLISGLVYLVFAGVFSTIQLGLVLAVKLLWPFAPLFLLFGMNPSSWGRTLLKTIAELWVSLHIRQVVVGIVAMTSLIMLIAIMKSTSSGPLLQVLMMIIAGILTIRNWQFIKKTMTTISFGGKSEQLGNINNPAKTLAAMSLAGLSSLAGSAIGARKGRASVADQGAGSRPALRKLTNSETTDSEGAGNRKNKSADAPEQNNDSYQSEATKGDGAGNRKNSSNQSEHKETSPTVQPAAKDEQKPEDLESKDVGAGLRKRSVGLPEVDLGKYNKARSSHALPKALGAAWKARNAESLADAAATGYGTGHAATEDATKHNARRRLMMEQAKKRRQKSTATAETQQKRTAKTKPVVDTRKKNRI